MHAPKPDKPLLHLCTCTTGGINMVTLEKLKRSIAIIGKLIHVYCSITCLIKYYLLTILFSLNSDNSY